MVKRKLAVRDVTWADLEEISKLDLMDDDLMELEGTGSTDTAETLVNSCMKSMKRTCKCIYVITTGEIVGIYGITNDYLIWFLSSKTLQEHTKEFLKYTREEFKVLTEGEYYAFNFVHWNHRRAISWLTWLGLKRKPGFYEFPPHTERYIRFEFSREVKKNV